MIHQKLSSMVRLSGWKNHGKVVILEKTHLDVSENQVPIGTPDLICSISPMKMPYLGDESHIFRHTIFGVPR